MNLIEKEIENLFNDISKIHRHVVMYNNKVKKQLEQLCEEKKCHEEKATESSKKAWEQTRKT